MIVERTLAEKMSAAIIAEKIGIGENTLSAMLNGRQKIDVDTFFAIAVVLHLTPDQIYAFRKGA